MWQYTLFTLNNYEEYFSQCLLHRNPTPLLRRFRELKQSLGNSVFLWLGEPTQARQQSCEKSATLQATLSSSIQTVERWMIWWKFKSSCSILIFLPWISDQVVHPRSILESKQSPRLCIDMRYNTLMPQRGEHNIENQMVFKGNPGFIFHDSRGFEAGGDQELKLVQQFIEQRSKAGNVKEQLHAIWCVGTCIHRKNQFLMCFQVLHSNYRWSTYHCSWEEVFQWMWDGTW